MNVKKCVLDENKICDDCGECNYCDLNPFKICDNCGKCIGMNEEYREIKIDEIMLGGSKKKPVSGNEHHHEHCDCGHSCECDDDGDCE